MCCSHTEAPLPTEPPGRLGSWRSAGWTATGQHCLEVESNAVDDMVQLSASPCLRVDGV